MKLISPIACYAVLLASICAASAAFGQSEKREQRRRQIPQTPDYRRREILLLPLPRAGADWSTLVADADGSILSTQVAGSFVGSYIGLFARTYQIVQTSQSSVSSNSVSTSQSKGSP
jgi:hypothetical protein